MTNDRFRDSVEIDFGDRTDVRDKKFLEILMRRRGYFNAKDIRKRELQSQLLLDSAWNHLKGYYKVKEVSYEYHGFNVYVVKVHGFRKRQLREVKTGKIRGWIL